MKHEIAIFTNCHQHKKVKYFKLSIAYKQDKFVHVAVNKIVYAESIDKYSAGGKLNRKCRYMPGLLESKSKKLEIARIFFEDLFECQ